MGTRPLCKEVTMEWSTEMPWQGMGVDITPDLSPGELVAKVKLDFEISRVTSGLPKSFANEEMFKFFKLFAQHASADLETIGTLANGRIVWALASLNAEFTLKETDTVKTYLMLSSRDEKRDMVNVGFTAVRPGGSSTFPVTSKARTSFKNVCRRTFKSEFPFMSPKSGEFEEDMIKRAQKAVRFGREAVSDFGSAAERLANKKVDDQVANRYMFDVFQPNTADKLASIGDKEINGLAEKNTRRAIEAITMAPGQDLESSNMTAWGLLNAVSYAIDHRMGANQDSRLRVAWFGPNAKIKTRALKLALELCAG